MTNAETYLKLYGENNSYISRELGLINNRVTWILTIHGFLYATYGLTLQKQLEIVSGTGCRRATDLLWQSEIFMSLVAIVGISISYFGWRSIRAAVRAMDAVSDIFNQQEWHKEENLSENQERTLRIYRTKFGISMPHLQGGGTIRNALFGNSESQVVPWILMISWALSLIAAWLVVALNKGFCS